MTVRKNTMARNGNDLPSMSDFPEPQQHIDGSQP